MKGYYEDLKLVLKKINELNSLSLAPHDMFDQMKLRITRQVYEADLTFLWECIQERMRGDLE